MPAGVLVVASALSYLVLYAVFGYTLELVFLSSLVFVVVGLLLLFVKELEVSTVAKILSLVHFLGAA